MYIPYAGGVQFIPTNCYISVLSTGTGNYGIRIMDSTATTTYFETNPFTGTDAAQYVALAAVTAFTGASTADSLLLQCIRLTAFGSLDIFNGSLLN